MKAIKQIVIGAFIGFIFIIAYTFLLISATPKSDIFLIAANYNKTENGIKKAIAKIYLEMAEDKTCSTDGYYMSGRVVEENDRFLFAAKIAWRSTNDENHSAMDKKIISKELHEASKYCRNFVFDKNANNDPLEYPPPVYIILSKDVNYFEIITKNCVSFDEEYRISNNSIRTARSLLQNLMSRSEGEDHAIYTEMMNSLRRNEARCSGR